MAGYIGSKAVLLSTTAAVVTGDMTVAGATTLSGAFTSKGIDDNATSTAITIDGSQNVGIGTSSPTQALVVSESSTPTIQIKDGLASGTRVSGRLLIGESDTLGVSIENSTVSYNDNCAMVFKTSPPAGTITERMRIDSAGRVTMPYQPSFRASFSNINYNQSGGISPVFNYTEHNRGNHYNTSTGVFTAPVAGSYLFSMGMATEATSTAAYFVIELMVNGAIDYTKFSISAVNTGITEGGISGSVVCSLQANDAVKVLWYTPATISVGRAIGGPNVWWNGRNYFSGCFLG